MIFCVLLFAQIVQLFDYFLYVKFIPGNCYTFSLTNDMHGVEFDVVYKRSKCFALIASQTQIGIPWKVANRDETSYVNNLRSVGSSHSRHCATGRCPVGRKSASHPRLLRSISVQRTPCICTRNGVSRPTTFVYIKIGKNILRRK